MNRAPAVVRWTAQGTQKLEPSTLSRLGHNEEFLENVLALHPELLGIQNRRTGIYGPFAAVQQVPLPTPAGRVIYPDVVLLSASGHFIVVEVKLEKNEELKDRRVIAQIIDYAASFSALNDEQLLCALKKSSGSEGGWSDYVAGLFPTETELEELADRLRENIASGAINLVIACDRVPPGLPEIVAGIASQQTTAFDLDLVELLPFVEAYPQGPEEILFVPTHRLSTEIIGRTSVTVTYEAGTTRPEVAVDADTPGEIEQRKKQVTASPSPSRVWPPEEVEAVFRDEADPKTLRLLEFAKEHSADGKFVSEAVKSNATFGFYIDGRKDDGQPARYMFFWHTHGWDSVKLYVKMMGFLVDEDVLQQLVDKLSECFGEHFDPEKKEPFVPLAAVHERLDDFLQIVLWFREQAALRLSEEY